jgi:ATP-binding cassette subfamily B protein
VKSFPFYRQTDSMDCGPTCLRMIAKFYGKIYSRESLRQKSYIDRQGVSLLGLSDAAEAIGLRSTAALATYDALVEEKPLPAIIHWRNNHFIVLYKIEKDKAFIADPSHGKVSITRKDFIASWSGNIVDGEKESMILFFQPAPEFYKIDDHTEDAGKRGVKELLYYLLPYKNYLIQLVLVLICASLLQFMFPFLTQSIVDIGIHTKNLDLINLVLFGLLMLFLGRIFGDFIRSWIILHVGSRINITMISDFLAKLTRLPISFFDSKITGDLMQRVNDHQRIQFFLTTTVTSALFSLLTLIVFSVILLWYDLTVFAIFFVGSLLYISWIVIFLKKRKKIDYQRFAGVAGLQSGLIQFIHGMSEIKMNNAEKQNRWKWERIQAKVFRVGVKGLALEQYQQIGSSLIHEVKNIFITFIAARAVISGDITLGAMLSIQYIIGQLNSPITELIAFIRTGQDAMISLERIGEIFSKQDEDEDGSLKIAELPVGQTIEIRHLHFQYGGANSPMVLKNINLTIEQGKTTAIVGSSGSGKTTLLKILLKFYEPQQGSIKIGINNLKDMSSNFWRSRCGVVMQDGFIFSDTIARNIAVADEEIDKTRLLYAVKMANIQHFIETLPLNYNTRIGNDGVGLSGGERQRLLIARAIYKNPQFIFFDEATSALDGENEKIILTNLHHFFEGKTVVIIAHRLSTVTNADNILVLHDGELVEEGTHLTLTNARGMYYHLVKNQLELGA